MVIAEIAIDRMVLGGRVVESGGEVGRRIKGVCICAKG